MIWRCLGKLLARWIGREMVFAEAALESVTHRLREELA